MEESMHQKKQRRYSSRYMHILKLERRARQRFYTPGLTPGEKNTAYQEWKRLRDALKESRNPTPGPADTEGYRPPGPAGRTQQM